ncbi:MAG TPA: hypothetical protein VHD83_13785 [Puia sp.]|nr:hypothetical protein [Puia sp.]
MPLSRSQFESELVPGKVLYFSCEELGTLEPHFFICIVRQPDDIIVLSCGTSQFNTVMKLIERKRFPNETLVFIPAEDGTNPFSKDTYINCNEYFPYDISELWDMYDLGRLAIRGDIAQDSLHQIILGFHKSPIIEYEVKEMLPDPDSF